MTQHKGQSRKSKIHIKIFFFYFLLLLFVDIDSFGKTSNNCWGPWTSDDSFDDLTNAKKDLHQLNTEKELAEFYHNFKFISIFSKFYMRVLTW